MTKYIIKPDFTDMLGAHYCIYKVGWFWDSYITYFYSIENCNKVIQHLEQDSEQIRRV